VHVAPWRRRRLTTAHVNVARLRDGLGTEQVGACSAGTGLKWVLFQHRALSRAYQR